MTRYLFFLCAVLFSLSAASDTSAAYVYTFEGNISSIYDDAGIISDAGLQIGDHVSYVFLIDYDRQGESILNDGTVISFTDSTNYDSFYAKFISGSYIQEKDGGFYNSPKDHAENNYGSDHPISESDPRISSSIYGRSSDELIQLTNISGPVSSWSIDQGVAGYDMAYDSNGIRSYFYTPLTLTNISTVPIPSAIWLLGSAFIGLVGFRKCRKG